MPLRVNAKAQTRRASAAAMALAAVAGVGACSGPAEAAEPLTVFAAASLTDVFAQIERGFEIDHPGVEVTTVYGGSADLAAQIVEGAPADVFAAAHPAPLDAVADEWAGAPAVFATNTLTLAVPTGNPAGVTSLADLAADDLTSVICAPQVPCGHAVVQLAALQSLELMPSSQESSATDVLGKVASGQADAGVVYVTDIARSAEVEEVTISGADAVANNYPIVRLAGARDAELAEAFVAYVTDAEGLAILASAGFGAP